MPSRARYYKLLVPVKNIILECACGIDHKIMYYREVQSIIISTESHLPERRGINVCGIER